MKKKFLALVLAGTLLCSLASCGKSGNTEKTDDTPVDGSKTEVATATPAPNVTEDVPENEETGEFVDGKFAEKRHITVEIYDRGNDGGTDPTDNMYTDYIKKGMLDTYNVEVEFISVPRWTEVDQINNLLASGDAPDICLTYDYSTILAYADMGGVMDLSSYVDDNKDMLPNLWAWLGEENIYYDKDPKTGTIWAIEGKRANTRRINTFIRQDWLNKLGLSEPTTAQEFEDALVAFKENADTLLGSEAEKMVPFSISFDVGWRAANIIDSYLDPNITDKEFYVNGFDDRKFTENGTKEAIRLLNKWYNKGLIWKEFPLYASGDTAEDDMIKAGYVGAFMHNWDYPFQTGINMNNTLKSIVGDDAKFVAIDCFQNSNGDYAKYSYSTAGDRKIFFPTTNDEPIASLLYLDWISDPVNIQYLQIGEEGQTHNVLEDGTISVIAAKDPYIQNSGQNIDMTITCNGLHLADEEITLKSIANNYSGSDVKDVMKSMELALQDAIVAKAVNVGVVASEAGVGNALKEKRDIIFDNAVVAAESDFDEVWDNGMEEYLSAGGQAIMDERLEKWEATYGDVDMLP